jgi:hypothetical protein
MHPRRANLQHDGRDQRDSEVLITVHFRLSRSVRRHGNCEKACGDRRHPDTRRKDQETLPDSMESLHGFPDLYSLHKTLNRAAVVLL